MENPAVVGRADCPLGTRDGADHPGRRMPYQQMGSCRAPAKTRILSILKERARRGDAGLSNQEIRQITHYDRNQVVRLMQELRAENPEIRLDGAGRSTRYSVDRAPK